MGCLPRGRKESDLVRERTPAVSCKPSGCNQSHGSHNGSGTLQALYEGRKKAKGEKPKLDKGGCSPATAQKRERKSGRGTKTAGG